MWCFDIQRWLNQINSSHVNSHSLPVIQQVKSFHSMKILISVTVKCNISFLLEFSIGVCEGYLFYTGNYNELNRDMCDNNIVILLYRQWYEIHDSVVCQYFQLRCGHYYIPMTHKGEMNINTRDQTLESISFKIVLAK